MILELLLIAVYAALVAYVAEDARRRNVIGKEGDSAQTRNAPGMTRRVSRRDELVEPKRVYRTLQSAANVFPACPGTASPTLPSPCARCAGSALTLISIM